MAAEATQGDSRLNIESRPPPIDLSKPVMHRFDVLNSRNKERLPVTLSQKLLSVRLPPIE